MSDEEKLTEEDFYAFLDAMNKFDQIKIPNDYTEDELRQAIMELAEEEREKNQNNPID